MTTHTPLRCANSSMTQRGTHEVVLLDTGNYPSFSSFLNETWTWNGLDYTNTGTTLIDANGPLPGRINAVMAYDGTNVMLFGGQAGSSVAGVMDDLWLWSGSAWSKSSAAVPTGRYKAAAAYLAGTGVVMFGGENVLGMLEETQVWSGSVWSQTTVANGAGPAARTDAVMAANTSVAILFGGQGTNSQYNDLWTYNGSWTQKFPTTSPSVRSDAVMAYDVTHAKFVLFGGKDEFNYLPQTWLYDSVANTWTQAAPATSPPGLVGAQMCWDSQSGKILLFGGISATANYPSNQSWSWDGTTWAAL